MVRNAADYRRWQADLARREGNSERARQLDGEADALAGIVHLDDPNASYAQRHGLTPRTRSQKPTSPLRCEGLSGPNIVRFKFLDRSGVAQRDGQLRAERALLGSRLAADVEVVRGLPLQFLEAHTASVEQLDRYRLEGELASGQELPDVTQWFEVVAGPRAVADLREDREACELAARVVNTLNGLDSVEIAYLAPTGRNAQTWSAPPQPVDLPPTTPAFESPAMATQPATGSHGTPVGLDSPETPSTTAGEFSPFLQPGWEGDGIRVVISEGANPAPHEKVAAFVIPGMTPDDSDAAKRDHATAVASIAFGSSRSGVGGPRYGTRGHAPSALGGSLSIEDTQFWFPVWVRYARPGMAIETMAPYLGNGDVVNFSYCIRSSDWSPDRPIETDEHANQQMHLLGSNGVVFINAACNSGVDLNVHGFPSKPPTSYIVGSTTGQFLTQPGGGVALTRAAYSNYGSRINFWAPSFLGSTGTGLIDTPFAARRDLNSYAPLWSTSDPSQFYAPMDGTSSAAPAIAGTFAQMQGLFQAYFGWRLGTGDGANGTVQIGEALRSSLGPWVEGARQPNLRHTAMERMLSVRITGCNPERVYPPFAREVSVVAPSGVQLNYVPSPLPSCAIRFPTAGLSPVEAHEVNRGFPIGPLDLDAAQLTGFTVEARVIAPQVSASWQEIVAKNNPRNYGMWVTPTGVYGLEGRVHFSYFYNSGQGVQNCALYGTRNIADNQPHHIATVFNATSFPPLVTIFVDGTIDRVQSGCAGYPLWNGGSGANMLEIGRDVVAGTVIGDVRLYHYPVGGSRIIQHAGAYQ